MCQKILNFGFSVHDPFKSWILKTSALAQMLSSIADFTSCNVFLLFSCCFLNFWKLQSILLVCFQNASQKLFDKCV